MLPLHKNLPTVSMQQLKPETILLVIIHAEAKLAETWVGKTDSSGCTYFVSAICRVSAHSSAVTGDGKAIMNRPSFS